MANLPTIRIGTRKSPLALAQAGHMRDRLMAVHPGLEAELVHIITSGDRFVGPLADAGGKGLFTKEIEEALLKGEIDLAVHSAKDMPTVLPDGLVIGCMPEREDACDVLVSVPSLAVLPKGATFGTSSLRRAAQVLMHRPDLQIVPLRGNVETRLKKVESGEVAATLLAMAGLKRLGIAVGVKVGVDEILPAVGQGALILECRANDKRILELLAPLSHKPTEMAVICERAFLRALDGSCRTPIAGYATVEKNEIRFTGLLIAPDGSNPRRIQAEGTDAETLGREAGEKLRR